MQTKVAYIFKKWGELLELRPGYISFLSLITLVDINDTLIQEQRKNWRRD